MFEVQRTSRPALAVLVAVASATLCPSAQASFVPAFSGNTRPQQTPVGIGGTVNFAVYTRDGTGTDPFDTGIADFTTRFFPGSGSGSATAGQYLYLYQAVNNGTTPGFAIEFQSVLIPFEGVRTYGSFNNLGFVGTVGTPAAQGNPSGVSLGTPTLSVGGVIPTSLVSQFGNSDGRVLGLALNYTNGLGADQRGMAFGFFSDVAPAFRFTSVSGGLPPITAIATGTVASLVPEPAAASLLAVIAPLGLVRRRR